MAESRLHELSRRGQSVWIDFLSRDLVQKGGLKRLMDEDAVVGVTSNPTIFQKAISQGNAYDEQLSGLLEDTDNLKEIFLALAVLNEIVWRNFSTDTWVSFKVFGALPLTFVFAMLQMPLLNKYAPPEAED